MQSIGRWSVILLAAAAAGCGSSKESASSTSTATPLATTTSASSTSTAAPIATTTSAASTTTTRSAAAIQAALLTKTDLRGATASPVDTSPGPDVLACYHSNPIAGNNPPGQISAPDLTLAGASYSSDATPGSAADVAAYVKDSSDPTVLKCAVGAVETYLKAKGATPKGFAAVPRAVAIGDGGVSTTITGTVTVPQGTTKILIYDVVFAKRNLIVDINIDASAGAVPATKAIDLAKKVAARI